MTIPASSVPAAVNALYVAIQAQLADGGENNVLVCIGDPSQDAPNDIIEVASAVRRTVSPLAMVGGGGQNWLQETFEVDVDISSAMETVDVSTDPLTLLDRVWQLANYVEVGIRSDPSLGGIVLEARPLSSSGSAPVWAENEIGRICEVVLPIYCTTSL